MAGRIFALGSNTNVYVECRSWEALRGSRVFLAARGSCSPHWGFPLYVTVYVPPFLPLSLCVHTQQLRQRSSSRAGQQSIRTDSTEHTKHRSTQDTHSPQQLTSVCEFPQLTEPILSPAADRDSTKTGSYWGPSRSSPSPSLPPSPQPQTKSWPDAVTHAVCAAPQLICSSGVVWGLLFVGVGFRRDVRPVGFGSRVTT